MCWEGGEGGGAGGGEGGRGFSGMLGASLLGWDAWVMGSERGGSAGMLGTGLVDELERGQDCRL